MLRDCLPLLRRNGGRKLRPRSVVWVEEVPPAVSSRYVARFSQISALMLLSTENSDGCIRNRAKARETEQLPQRPRRILNRTRKGASRVSARAFEEPPKLPVSR